MLVAGTFRFEQSHAAYRIVRSLAIALEHSNDVMTLDLG